MDIGPLDRALGRVRAFVARYRQRRWHGQNNRVQVEEILRLIQGAVADYLRISVAQLAERLLIAIPFIFPDRQQHIQNGLLESAATTAGMLQALLMILMIASVLAQFHQQFSSPLEEAIEYLWGSVLPQTQRALTVQRLDGQMTGVDEVAECAICHEEVSIGTEVSVLPCGHWFHVMCIDSWLAQSSTCPFFCDSSRI